MAESRVIVTDNPLYKWLILMNVMIASFMVVLDITVVNTAMKTIMGDLGAGLSQIEWILTGYLLSLTVILPTTGWFTDRVGIKRLFIAAISVFTFGSFMCGNSSSIEGLIFWRVVQGFGSGIVIPAGMVLVTQVFPLEQRGMALGFWAIASAASISFGPMIGGALVDSLSWNAIFFLNVPIGLFCIIFSYFIQKKDRKTTKRPFDFWGFLFSSLFLPIFLLGLTYVNASSNTSGWSNPIVLGCMWISVVSLVTFIFIELRSKSPLIRLSIFKDKNFTVANLIITIFGISMFGSSFLIPLYVQESLGYDAFQSGLLFLPVGLLQTVFSPLSGIASKKIDPRIIIALGLILMSVSFYMNSFLTTATTHRYILLSLCIRGVGFGILFPPLMNMSLYNIKKELIPEASSITNILRQIGGSFGIALLSFIIAQREVFHSVRYTENLAFNSAMYMKGIENIDNLFSSRMSVNAYYLPDLTNNFLQEQIMNDAFIQGINDAFIVGMVINTVVILCVLFLAKQKNHQEL